MGSSCITLDWVRFLSPGGPEENEKERNGGLTVSKLKFVVSMVRDQMLRKKGN